MKEKLKSFLANDQLFYGALVVLVGFCAFGLGRASISDTAQQMPASPTISITSVPELTAESAVQAVLPEVGVSEAKAATIVIASRSGTKYHLPNCPGAAQIKPENQISFDSVEAAEAAGYTPAANCPGLK